MGKPKNKLNPERQRTRFSKDFKLEAVWLLELGINRNQLYKWQEQLRKTGTDTALRGPGRKPLSEQSEVERLKRELKKVTEERDILKKAAACFARELP